MTYADTDFFLALLKETDWLQERAGRIFEQEEGELWTSPATLIELLMLARRFDLDPEEVLAAVLKIAPLRYGEEGIYYLAARFMKRYGATALDAVHASFCGKQERIISSDTIFDKIGLERVRLEVA